MFPHMESSCNILFPSFDPRTWSVKGKQSKLYGCVSWVQKGDGNFKMKQYENNINVKRRPVSSVRIRFDNHKNIRTFLTHNPLQTDALLANNSQHCWMSHVVSVCTPCFMFMLLWPEHIYMSVGYVFESRFSAGMI